MLSGYGLKNSRKVLLVVLVQWCLSEKTLYGEDISLGRTQILGSKKGGLL